ncbi:hypothetical protein PVAND_000251 [Polypedilum vanderplanki]|uniref:DUF659 domain-containing protein n=1 Tax=Polypedilum vanderplanki TaxID=319348 RepID=A0A9J6BJR3_POLVA|nr:hypothetical protein PVAND_000251 [Polypedilum vanderplanki]
MKAAWKLIEVKFPHISASGCAAHGMNLLIKDITSTTESAKTIKESEKIIKFIKNHHLVKAMFDERRLAANVLSSLCLPVPTRWYSLFNSMNNLLVSKYVLIKLADEKYDELKDMQPKSTSAAVLTLLKSNAFWDRLAKLVKDIEFPSNIIGKLESDDAPLSLVYDYFGQLYNYYENDEAIQLKVMSRLKFIFTPFMGLAFLLTPKHAADGFYFEENKLDFIAAAYDQAIKVNPEIADNVHLQMIEFTGEMATLTQKRKDTLFKMSAKNYWNIIGREIIQHSLKSPSQSPK